MGEFSAPPSDTKSWQPFYDLEGTHAAFREISDESDFSYPWLKNQGSEFVSRIDLKVVTLSVQERAGTLARLIRWKPIQRRWPRPTASSRPRSAPSCVKSRRTLATTAVRLT